MHSALTIQSVQYTDSANSQTDVTEAPPPQDLITSNTEHAISSASVLDLALHDLPVSAQPSGRSGRVKNDIFAIKATLNNARCNRFCKCQCHIPGRVETPRWLRAVAGSLFYAYTGSPWLHRRSCNYVKCKGHSTYSSQFTYYFPSWMISRAFVMSRTWHHLTGIGSSWTISIPRVIADENPV